MKSVFGTGEYSKHACVENKTTVQYLSVQIQLTDQIRSSDAKAKRRMRGEASLPFIISFASESEQTHYALNSQP